MNPDTQLNHYRIVSPLGEGGMGQVYRAEDTRLKRQVAIKVLPKELASDPERLARLEREAQLLAQLEHPNVAAVYGLEESEGTRFLVMQLVEGETLADRIATAPVPVKSAMSMGLQIAEGLEAAHERGIIHRDLKPANIMVSDDGAVKILDFGLAKAGDPSASGMGSAPELTASPTMMAPTQAGVILGTAAYMSPEQARGKALDRRSDIWAFGCVLYEMLTGRQGFGGETVTDILAAIVHRSPDMDALPGTTPWRLRELLERCLEKDPVQRLRDVGDARIALQQAIADPAPSPRAGAAEHELRPRRLRSWLATALVAAGVALVAVLVVAELREEEAAAPLRRFELGLDEPLQTVDRGPRLSPDGARVVFFAGGQLWVRDLTELDARPLPDTADATFPFWSPDSDEIAYFAEGTLWRAPLRGGSRTAVTSVGEVENGYWAPDGYIYFGLDPHIARVSARGGDPTMVVPIADLGDAAGSATLDLHDPHLLPDGVSLLYRFHGVGANGSLMLWNGSSSRVLIASAGQEQISGPVFSRSGHILYERRNTANAGVWAVPFDAEALELTGDPFLVAAGYGFPSVARDGSLLMVRGASNARFAFTWVTWDGELLGNMGAPADTQLFRLAVSPQGDRVALALSSEQAADIWLLDERGGRVRLTSQPESELYPAWSPAGDRVVYTLRRNQGELWSQAVDGSAPPQLLGEGRRATFSPDGRYLVYELSGDDNGPADIWLMDLEGEESPRVWMSTPEAEREPVISPDGRLIAYTVGMGTSAVHIRNFPAGDGRRVVSTAGGVLPRWSSDGGTLYYVADNQLMAVRLADGQLGEPEVVLSSRQPGLASIIVNGMLGYGLHPDGDRALVPTALENENPLGMVLTQNWWLQFAEGR